MRAGITGTRRPIPAAQADALRDVLAQLAPSEIHHGDCVGADALAHMLALRLRVLVVVHPPVNPRFRAWCLGAYRTHTPRPYDERNRNVVDETDLLIALPFTPHEELRSGTWATVRYARKLNRPVIFIYRDGRTHKESALTRFAEMEKAA